jgi:hypothetical protein
MRVIGEEKKKILKPQGFWFLRRPISDSFVEILESFVEKSKRAILMSVGSLAKNAMNVIVERT